MLFAGIPTLSTPNASTAASPFHRASTSAARARRHRKRPFTETRTRTTRGTLGSGSTGFSASQAPKASKALSSAAIYLALLSPPAFSFALLGGPRHPGAPAQAAISLALLPTLLSTLWSPKVYAASRPPEALSSAEIWCGLLRSPGPRGCAKPKNRILPPAVFRDF